MKTQILTPSFLDFVEISESEKDLVKDHLTFIDKSVQYQLRKTKKNRWFQMSNPEAWQARVDELKSLERQSLLFDENDSHEYPFTYAGILSHLKPLFPCIPRLCG